MKIRLPYIPAVIVVMTITGFTISNKNAIQKNTDITKARWLIGQWQNKTSRGMLYEQWEQINDSIFAGKSFYLRNNDTVVLETVSLKQDKRNLWYIPTVVNQNNGQSVRFKLTALTDNQIAFENPDHDFPQKITYSRISRDSLVAEISGIVQGKLKQERFPMQRSPAKVKGR